MLCLECFVLWHYEGLDPPQEIPTRSLGLEGPAAAVLRATPLTLTHFVLVHGLVLWADSTVEPRWFLLLQSQSLSRRREPRTLARSLRCLRKIAHGPKMRRRKSPTFSRRYPSNRAPSTYGLVAVTVASPLIKSWAWHRASCLFTEMWPML